MASNMISSLVSLSSNNHHNDKKHSFWFSTSDLDNKRVEYLLKHEFVLPILINDYNEDSEEEEAEAEAEAEAEEKGNDEYDNNSSCSNSYLLPVGCTFLDDNKNTLPVKNNGSIIMNGADHKEVVDDMIKSQDVLDDRYNNQVMQDDKKLLSQNNIAFTSKNEEKYSKEEEICKNRKVSMQQHNSTSEEQQENATNVLCFHHHQPISTVDKISPPIITMRNITNSPMNSRNRKRKLIDNIQEEKIPIISTLLPQPPSKKRRRNCQQSSTSSTSSIYNGKIGSNSIRDYFSSVKRTIKTTTTPPTTVQ